MQIDLAFGHERLTVEVAEQRLVGVEREPAPPPLADPAGTVRAALETPLDYPPLRQALTPDDHVAVVLDERLPRLAELLTPLLAHIVEARVAPEAITLLCPSASRQEWLDELPDAFQDTRIEVHNPRERKKLSYLASTAQGRRVYLNRTAVDADQLIVLSGRGYDPQLGYSGAEGAVYPALSDEATLQELRGELSLAAPGAAAWPVRQEAQEVVWLLGAPFFVQVIEGAGDAIAHVLAGPLASCAEGQRLLDARWRERVAHPADTVIAGVSGDPEHHDFADLARALSCAARVVRPRGRIILLSGARPELGSGAELLRRAEDPDQALDLLRKQRPADMSAAFAWASAAQQAEVYLLSALPEETAEELFAIPLKSAAQVQRLLRGEGSCLFLNDAHKSLAVVDEGDHA
jgi:nickel-dependent lactate racemase